MLERDRQNPCRHKKLHHQTYRQRRNAIDTLLEDVTINYLPNYSYVKEIKESSTQSVLRESKDAAEVLVAPIAMPSEDDDYH